MPETKPKAPRPKDAPPEIDEEDINLDDLPSWSVHMLNFKVSKESEGLG